MGATANMSQPAYAPTYAQPAYAPQTTYAAPQPMTYAAPVQTYAAPAVHHVAQPVVQQPVVQHVAHTVMETQHVPQQKTVMVPQTQQTMHQVMETQKFIILDWHYDNCEVKPELVHSASCDGQGNNAIQYKVSVQAYGNDRDSSNVIEFYVDTTVDASCSYCNSFEIDAEGFWVNQEDVAMATNAIGDLSSLFNCNLYADAARQDKIEEHNIVNMGEYIFGEVTSSAVLPGLKYKLVDFKVSDASSANMGDFLVIAGGIPESVVDAQMPGGNSANTGASLLFSYLSFGFENLSGQNELDHTCKIQVELA